MPEFQPFSGVEGKTGLLQVPCIRFGNGVEIETRVYAKAGEESFRRTADGRDIHILPQKGGPDAIGADIVKIHFLPKTSVAERANEPELVPAAEKGKIGIDALQGFLSLAQAMKEGKVSIESHQTEEDFYLFADTNETFAKFLREKCGFRGTTGGSQAWIRKSQFIGGDNIRHMEDMLEKRTYRVTLENPGT